MCKLAPGAPGIALGLVLERGGKRFTPQTSLDPTNSLRSHGCALGALLGLVPFAPFAEVILEIVDSVASKRAY
jgi:hypothetical protein